MEGIEASEMLPSQALSVLGQPQSRTRTMNLAEMTPEAVTDLSDLKKQELAKDFESILLTRLFDEVKKSIDASSFDEDSGSDQVHSMFWSFLAGDVADKGGFGLWRDLYQQFKELKGGGTTDELMEKEL